MGAMRCDRRRVTRMGALALLLPLAGCGAGSASTSRIGPGASASYSAPLGEASDALVRIATHLGVVHVVAGDWAEKPLAGNGTADLMRGRFVSSDSRWEPEFGYRVDGLTGELTLRQAYRVRRYDGDQAESSADWTVALNPAIATDLRVDADSGMLDIRPGGARIRRLRIDVRTGQIGLDLSGAWLDDLDVHIALDAGQSIIKIPPTVGARIATTAGLGGLDPGEFIPDGGAFVNAAYGKTTATITVDVSNRVGQIKLVSL